MRCAAEGAGNGSARRATADIKRELKHDELARLLQPAANAARQLGIPSKDALEIFRKTLRASDSTPPQEGGQRWAALTSVVGAILSSLERRLGFFGQLVMLVIGLSWIVACYFVVPVLAQEGTGPITAIKRSVGLLQKTWGEGLTGNIVIAVTSFFAKTILIALLGAGLLLAHLSDSFDLAVVTVAVFLLCAISLTIFTSTLRQIFLAGLYTYAQTGSVPHGFSENSMRHALLPSK